jgi:hypothetical protein
MDAFKNQDPDVINSAKKRKLEARRQLPDTPAESTKRMRIKSKAIRDAEIHEESLVAAIRISKTLSQLQSPSTHLFRCELVRTLLTSGIAISKAHDLHNKFMRWMPESSDSLHALVRRSVNECLLVIMSGLFLTPPE